MITKFNEYNSIIDTSGSMSNVVIDPFINDFVSKIEIYEVDDFNDSNYTGNVIPLNFRELEKLIDLELTNYLLKPISYNELIDCLKNMLKRIDKLSLNDFQINYDINYNFLTKELINNKKNTQYKLSKSEIVLLELLLKNPNSIISIEIIQSHLSHNEIKSEQAIKNIIHRLRLKIGKDNIQNIQSLGYFFRKEI